MVKSFDYYKDIIKDMQDLKPFPVYRINQIGGRMGSKTYSAIEFIVIASLVSMVKTDAYRWTKGKDRKELFNQIGVIIDTYPGLSNIVVKHMTDMTYTFPNGSCIEVSGLRTMGSQEVQLTGKAGSTKFDYQIALAEERYEISDSAWADVLQAIRGTENFMEIHLANPWVFTNDYVKYCNDAMPFSLEKLRDDGEQFGVFKREISMMDGSVFKYRELFHYTNYQINHHLSQLDKVKLEVAAQHDPHRANTILYGFPGAPKGGIWKWVLPKMKQKPRERSVTFIGGVDYGERDDPTSAYVIGFNAGNSHAHIEHEYYFRNRDGVGHRDTRILAEDVVNHYLDFLDDNGMQHDRIEVMVDGSSIPFITALNTYAQNLGEDHRVKFYQQTNKKRVADRIETMKTLASFGLITVDEKCIELLRELNEQTYADKSRTSNDYVNGDDHGTDAIYYALVTKWVELQQNMDLLITQEAEATIEGDKNV